MSGYLQEYHGCLLFLKNRLFLDELHDAITKDQKKYIAGMHIEHASQHSTN